MTVKQVEKLVRDAKPGATADGDGLYLKITPGGSASWQYRYQINGKRRMMGLGAVSGVTLAQAREKASVARAEVRKGVDPLDTRQADENAARARRATFAGIAAEYIADHRPAWRNAKHGQQWENTLATYAFPVIGAKPPEEITTEHVLQILKPIWLAKPETASRVRNRIELVIDAARAQGLSTAPNPAAWRGHLDKLLPKRSKTSKGHHAAMDCRDLPAFFRRLSAERSSISARALAFTILTACRTSEVLNARHEEFDIEHGLWTVPAERMKAGRPHRVPLSDAALAIIEGAGETSGYVFRTSYKRGISDEPRPLSGMSMAMCLRKLGHPELTVHGFRSTFRDWAAEETHYPNIVAEQALAHTVGSAVEAAYRRGDLLEKRRALMADWADYCTGTPAVNVVPLKSITAA